MAVLMFVLMLIGVAVYLFAPRLRAKQLGFGLAVVSLLVGLFSHIAAVQQRHHIEHRDSAVIMAPSVVVKSTPSQTGTDLFILHEGTRVEIDDNSMKEWVEIQMNDGKQGWIRRADIEVI